MTEYKKPLPVVQPWSKAFWEAAINHKLIVQECQDCKTKIFYPRQYCPECWSSNLGWMEASGKATLYTYTVTLGGVEEKFAEDLPIILAMVDLEEGVRMMTKIVDCDPKEVSIGMDLEVAFEDINDEFSLPFFRPLRS